MGKYCYIMEKIILLEQNNHSRTYIKNINWLQKWFRNVFWLAFTWNTPGLILNKSFGYPSRYSMLGFTDEVARTNIFLRWWSVSIEQYLLFTKFMMETVFSHMYVDVNLQQNRRAVSGRVGNRDGGRCFQKMVNSCYLHLYIVA